LRHGAVTSKSTYRPRLWFLAGPGQNALVLEPTVAEIELHVHAGGWDRPPLLFALVRAGHFSADDPTAAARLGIDQLPADALTPIEQDELPDEPLDELLAGIGWPAAVDGCAVSQEIVILPPSAAAELNDDLTGDLTDEQVAARAIGHPERREARLVVAVLRDGANAALLRMRNADGGGADDVLTGPELAPNLVAALLATFDD
jgi:hypothetical protein